MGVRRISSRPVPRRHVAIVIVGMVLFAAGCASEPVGPLPDAPTPVTSEDLEAAIADGAPTVVNVWASWCIPCRSEAPIVAAASTARPGVTFIGLNVRDDPDDARSFIAQHLDDAVMTHLSDRSGRVPIDLGGTSGVPLTFFYGSDGELVHLHFGVIDEPTMARYLDEIDR